MANQVREQVIKAVAVDAGITQEEAKVAVRATLSAIKDNLVTAGDAFRGTPLGTFKVVHRPSRQARNPATGETIMTAPKDAIKFTQSVS